MPDENHFTFYSPWPAFGKNLSQQWDDIRFDTEVLHPLVRQVVYDKDECKNESVVLGYEYGDKDKRNRFRTIYNEDTQQWVVQVNNGTQANPDWETAFAIGETDFYDLPTNIRVRDTKNVNSGLTDTLIFDSSDFYLTRDSNKKFQVHSRTAGGGGGGAGDITGADNVGSGAEVFKEEVGGVLRLRSIVAANDITVTQSADEITIGRTTATSDCDTPYIARKKTFNSSKEWIQAHKFNILPVTADVYDDNFRLVIPDEVDVSDPSITYFYWSSDSAGNAITSAIPCDSRVKASVTPAALEWEVTHNLGKTPIGVEIYDLNYRRIIPDELDVSNPNIAYFYFSEAASGHVLFHNPRGAKIVNFSSEQSEWIVNHSLDALAMVDVYDDNFRRVIPDEVDTSDPNITYFYFSEPTAGTAIINAGIEN